MKTVTVSADALWQLLQAVTGQAHCIRELQVTRGISAANPINILLSEYNAAVEAYNKESEDHTNG